MSPNETSDSRTFIESHSFNYVPKSDRHGSVTGQTQFWFMINATIITALAGTVGPLAGLSLQWTLIALVIGNLIGVSFQAFHGTQGPHMGLPQMIQSRVQFGARGALIPIAAAAIIQIGFGIFNLQTASQSLGNITAPQPVLYPVVLGAAAILTAIVGFRLIMAIEKLASYFMVANLLFLTIAVFATLPMGDLMAVGGFVPAAFIAQIAAAATYQIALAPMISDMTRYLPAKIGNRAVVTSVFCGTLVSATWIEALGAVAVTAYPDEDAVAALAHIGNSFGFGLGTITLTIAIVVTLATFTQGMYSGSIAVLSGLEAFKPLKPTARLRSIALGVAGLVVILASLLVPEDILSQFGVFLTILGYLLIPWTAINLTDYYLIRRGRYSITDILSRDGGLYGRWNSSGLTSYVIGMAVMIPFISLPFYTSPFAALIGGTDISFVAGFIGASVAYALLTRKLDLRAELSIVESRPLHTGSIRKIDAPSTAPSSELNPAN
ncbi:cytosine permease [Arthrobacter sp. AB6]|uniref:purine-cytosine permease family protein n=1 Tax=Arthrobacter sp. AB6 TaxID=2962570 RepID=UPI0028827673|nr:cytosine permease [Arthrobacter sp. AB6]MDT0196472.1 cytosine permease [Arthrobacter sp. AB6]